MDLADFQWQERQGRFQDDTPFHEWVMVHGSGRIMASVQGPTDNRGGFTHLAQFLFNQDVTMQGGPFIFMDFDGGKRFVESIVSEKVQAATPEGALTVQPREMPAEMSAMFGSLKEMGAAIGVRAGSGGFTVGITGPPKEE